MRFKDKITFAMITGLVPVLFLGGCGAATVPGTAGTVSENESSYITEQETTSPGINNPSAETSSQAEAPAREEDVVYSLPRIINQRNTSFGDYGCSGAAGLMALQAAGYLTDTDTDEEYARFWSGVPKNSDPTKGWNGNGIWNPAYADWLATFAEAKRIQDFSADDLKQFIAEGNVAIVLVSLGDTGSVTHWMAVTGFKTVDGLLLYQVADPWSGMLHEFTPARLQKRMEEGARRKGDYGAGYGTDGVLIKSREL